MADPCFEAGFAGQVFYTQWQALFFGQALQFTATGVAQQCFGRAGRQLRYCLTKHTDTRVFRGLPGLVKLIEDVCPELAGFFGQAIAQGLHAITLGDLRTEQRLKFGFAQKVDDALRQLTTHDMGQTGGEGLFGAGLAVAILTKTPAQVGVFVDLQRLLFGPAVQISHQ
ncbi:hypothetical protein D3C84_898250 [compost metagenome]